MDAFFFMPENKKVFRDKGSLGYLGLGILISIYQTLRLPGALRFPLPGLSGLICRTRGCPSLSPSLWLWVHGGLSTYCVQRDAVSQGILPFGAGGRGA